MTSRSLTRTVAVASTRFLLREEPADGRPVLLLHGVPETSSCWRDLAPALAAAGRRTLAPDLPGLGGSAFPGPFDLASVAAEVAALLDHETQGPVDVVGHDWGGGVALALAAVRPDLVRRLVLLNAAHRSAPLRRAPHVPLFALPVLPEAVFRLGGARLVDLMLRLGWKAATPLDPELRSEYLAAYADPARVPAMLAYYRAAVRPQVRALLPGQPAAPRLPQVVTQDATVLWGAADPVLPVQVAERIAAELGPTTTVVTVPGAGHFVHEEAPETTREVVLGALLRE